MTHAAAPRLHAAPTAQPRLRIGVVGATHPLIVGAAPFNDAMVRALRRRADVEFLSWRRMYPPLLYRGAERDPASSPPAVEHADFVLAWHEPWTWRRARNRLVRFGAGAVVLPWLHPVMALPYRWLLRHAPPGAKRVVVCHNVLPHEELRGARPLTRATLGHADLFVTHAPQQRKELAELGLGGRPILELFHPRFVASDLAAPPDPRAVRLERARLGNPRLLLLCFGTVRPYKGVDLALEALAMIDPAVRATLVVAGRFWDGAAQYRRLANELRLGGRVELRDAYVSNDEAAVLFAAADGVVLPYRSATQSGVAQLAFAYGKPVVATAVGGLSAAVDHGRTGLLTEPDNAFALARAIERLAIDRERLARGVAAAGAESSFDRYAGALVEAVEGG